MTIEQFNSLIGNKEPLDQKAISQIMLLIEKYPYFQAAHMLLLKAMHVSQPEKYNGQLKISASFISDKKKLYHYIHADSIPVISVEEKKDFIKQDSIETKKIDTSKDIRSKIREKEEKLKEEKIIELENTQKIIPTQKTEILLEEKIEKTIEKTIAKSEDKKKQDLSEKEIELLANQNSEIKHKKIIDDFFHPSAKDNLNENETEIDKETISKKETIQTVKEKREFPDKQEIKALLEEKKKHNIAKNELIIQNDTSEFIEIDNTQEKKIEIPKIKDEQILENQIKSTEQIPIEKTKIEKTTKKIQEAEETVSKQSDLVGSGDKNADTMNNIFSKIRQIKKEMNIESVKSSETIDLTPKNEISKVVKSQKSEEIKGGKKIKESFIGFEEKDIKSDEIIGSSVKIEKNIEEEIKEEPIVKEEIKETGITAKDLFRQRLKNKEKNNESAIVFKEKTIETKSPISKIVESVNQTEIIEEQNIDLELNQTPVIKVEQKIAEETQINKNQENESAADVLLKRIADKKRRMQEEKEKEEIEKLQKIQEPETIIDKTETTKSTEITEISLSEGGIKSESTEVQQINNQAITNQITPVKEKKTQSLIDSFIQKADSLDRLGKKESSLVGDISERSTEEKEEFMTETMAELFVQQKNYSKAIEIYNKLILKFPEKKTYFAIQIKKTESLIK